MATEVMKFEVESETCCVCGCGGDLMTPEEHDAGTHMQVPLRTMLLQLNSNKAMPDGRLCANCIRRAMEAYEFSSALSTKSAPPLSEKIRALRRRLHELTQKIDVFIVVGGAGGTGSYNEDDIIMVERDALAAAAAADDEDLERARNARGDSVYQCSVCPLSFQRVSEYRSHAGTHPADAQHSCWTCGAQFASRAALAAHGRGAARGCVCPSCFRTCDTPELLSAHLLRHRQPRHFVCGYDACILRFATRSNLVAHIRKCHAGAAPEPASAVAPASAPASAVEVACPTCPRKFGSAAAMKRHARVHRAAPHLAEEGTESQDCEEIEGEVEYLEVEELEEIEYREQNQFEQKPLANLH